MHEPSEGRASFQREAIPHLDAVYRFALRLAGSADQAEDLVQETFLRAFNAWDQYEPGTRCKSWLFTICRNVFLRQWERTQHHDRLVREASAEGNRTAEVPVSNPIWRTTGETDPEGAFFDSFVDEEVLRHIERLPEEYRTVVLLSDLEGLSYQEIAALVEVPVGTVKSRLFRGRRQLQMALHDYAVEMGYLRRAGRDPGTDAAPPERRAPSPPPAQP